MEEIILQYLPSGLTAIVSLVLGIAIKIFGKKVTELTVAAKDQKNKELKELADRVDILVEQNNQLIEELIDTKEKELKITRIVQEMPEQRRKIFIMSRFELISNEQIASILGISKKTVENHLNLALKQLRLSGIF